MDSSGRSLEKEPLQALVPETEYRHEQSVPRNVPGYKPAHYRLNQPVPSCHVPSVARRKLRQLQIAGRLEDLRVPPGNRLEALKGNRAGQHSIRVNDQFRVCFRWTAVGAEDVEIVDYH